MALTKKQRRMIDYIGSFQELNGYSPSYEEIAAGLGYRSKGTVHKHLKNLLEKGVITKEWNRSRSVEIVPELSEGKSVSLPLLGLVAAGKTDREIGDELFIAVRTVTTHVGNILNKIGAANRTEAASYAIRQGLT